MKRLRDSLLALAGSLLVSLIAATPALSAGGAGSGGVGSGGVGNASGGGDDVETVPIVVQGGVGFVLRGSLEDVRLVLRTVQGQGTPQISLTSEGGTVEVVYRGHFRLRLESEMLEEGKLSLVPFGKGLSVQLRNGTWFVRG